MRIGIKGYLNTGLLQHIISCRHGYVEVTYGSGGVKNVLVLEILPV